MEKAILGGRVDPQVHVVGLAGELEQLALDVRAHGLHALFHPREAPVGEQVVPVGRHEHHVHVHEETAVATGAKAGSANRRKAVGSTFVGMLAYKARRGGRAFTRVDRWFPSTRACSACGTIGDAKPLHVRERTCPCGAAHDRDVNAAINILAGGRAESPTLVELVSAGTLVPQPAVKREPAGSTA